MRRRRRPRRPRLALVAATCAAIGVVALPAVAEAHDPIIVDDTQTAPEAGPLLLDGTISFALYGVVDAPGATRGFRAVLADGDRLVVSLLVPDLPPEQSLSPEELPTLLIDAPDGTATELAPDERVAFDEPFSGTRYLRLAELDEPAVAGEYAFTVVGRAPARFTVSVGTIEQFGTPVEGVLDRAAGVGGVQAWYDTPPPEPVATVPAEPATTAATTTVVPAASSSPTSEPTTTSTTATSTTSATSTSTSTPVDDETGPEPNGVVTSLIAAVVAVVVIGGTVVLVRRRRVG